MKPDVNLESMQRGPTLPAELAELGLGRGGGVLSALRLGSWRLARPPEGAGQGWSRLGLPLLLLFAKCLLPSFLGSSSLSSSSSFWRLFLCPRFCEGLIPGCAWAPRSLH